MVTRTTIVALAVVLASIVCTRPMLAGTALVFDSGDGRVLYAEDIDTPWFPASLTKLMTAYIAFKGLRDRTAFDHTRVYVSKNARRQPPTKLGMREGDYLLLSDALRALIIKSANDIAVAIAETLGGDEESFIKVMNKTAKELGMTRTHFMNPHGLPSEQQVTTARDMAILAQAIIDEFPDQMPLFAEEEVKVGKRILRTHNAIIVSYPGGDGMKTGFTCWSGYNLVASATRNGNRLVAVVMGASSGGARTAWVSKLLDYGFEMRDWKVLFVTPRIDNMPEAIETVGVGPNAAKAERMRVCERRATASSNKKKRARKKVRRKRQ